MKKKLLLSSLFLTFNALLAQSDDDYLNLNFEKADTFEVAPNRYSYKVKDWSPTIPTFWSSDAYEGKKAVKIFFWYSGRDGILNLGKEAVGQPYTKKPIALKGYYKYEYGDNCGVKDSAEAYLYLTKYNKQQNTPDTIAKGVLKLLPVAVYTPFEMTIKYKTNTEPDTIQMEFFSRLNYRGYVDTSCNPGSNNRFFTIDALSLVYSPSTKDKEILQSPIQIHPNPTLNTIHVDWSNNRVSDIIIKDILGITVHKKAVNTEGVSLDLSALPKGIYFVEFNYKGKHLATRKVVKE
jgi:hypothetical protein